MIGKRKAATPRRSARSSVKLKQSKNTTSSRKKSQSISPRSRFGRGWTPPPQTQLDFGGESDSSSEESETDTRLDVTDLDVARMETRSSLSPTTGSRQTKGSRSKSTSPSSILRRENPANFADNGGISIGSEAGPDYKWSENGKPCDAEQRKLMWVACDECGKWRSVPYVTDGDELSGRWVCSMHKIKALASCSALEESYRDCEIVTEDNDIHQLLGLDSLLHAFSFLDTYSLFRARQVSKLWRHVASHPPLWRHLRMFGSPTKIWRSLFEIVKASGSLEVDFRGTHDELKTLTVIPPGYFASVRHLRLPNALISDIEALVNACPLLATLTVDSISSYRVGQDGKPIDENGNIVNKNTFVNDRMYYPIPTLNLRIINQCKNLKVLQLRGYDSLQIPFFSFQGGLLTLKNLRMLRVLEITTLLQVPGIEFAFLRELKQLKALSIGYCELWNEDSFMNLEGLQELTMLRLEAGPSEVSLEHALGKSLLALPRLERLDIDAFRLSEHFGQYLEKISLQKLCVSLWRTDIAGDDSGEENINICSAIAQAEHVSNLKIVSQPGAYLIPQNEFLVPFGNKRWIAVGQLEWKLQCLMTNTNIFVDFQKQSYFAMRSNFTDEAIQMYGC